MNKEMLIITAQLLGGLNMILAIIFDSIPQAILGAVIFYHAINYASSEESE